VCVFFIFFVGWGEVLSNNNKKISVASSFDFAERL
jgi:hypothetical protein